jgi:hypothetical protein
MDLRVQKNAPPCDYFFNIAPTKTHGPCNIEHKSSLLGLSKYFYAYDLIFETPALARLTTAFTLKRQARRALCIPIFAKPPTKNLTSIKSTAILYS